METKQKGPSPIAWILSQTGDHGSQYVQSVILALAGVACSVAPYFVVIGVVHGLMDGQREFSFYLSKCLIMAVFWLLRVLCHAFSTSASHKATFAVLGEIRKRCTEKLTRMPLGAVMDRSTGALKNTLIERIDSIETTLAHIVPEFTANLLVPVVILIFVFTIDWRMGLASLATIPIGVFCYALMMTGSTEFYAHTLDATKALNNTAVEYINGIQVIKVFGKTKSSYDRFVNDAYEAAHSFIDWMRASILPMTFAMVVMPANMVSVLPVGGLLMKNGSLDPKDFVMVVILSVGLITPLVTMMSYSDDIRTMGTIFGEVQSILNAQEMERPEKGEVPESNDLVLENVRFSYKEKEVLHGINMEIPEGSFIALVGPSGSGKSTIARLIASLWDPDSGSIQLGGTDIRKISQEDYADRIAFVSQDNYLFNMSVRENIRLGRSDATDAEVEEAARQSGCHEFIMSLENGYDTMAGSSGGHLSGGERQRISIARAMLKGAPVVILDEATAYTDPENEAVIQRSVSKLTEGKTLIVIAHRLSTVADADQIYVIKDGVIDDHGTHDELLQRHGLYETMWNAHMEVKDNG
ncbi:MAG: ABC transporter ATP-binding protein [Erysipelotrichaceae bacterium]|nr:ABC transporter ATP-binding protein [Erysipelotrichaceae bacterium]